MLPHLDTILNLIHLAGDYVSEEVCYRIVQVVINTQEVQGYIAKTCFEVRGKTTLNIRHILLFLILNIASRLA